jgi:lysophospholipase L1-like esterase
VGGDRVTGGGGGPIDQRLERDVYSEKPTVVTIMLGMNDGSYRATTPEIESTYVKGYEHILESIHEHAPAARVTLLGPSPYDDVTAPLTFPGGYNAVMLHFADLDRDLAQKYGAAFTNLNPPVVAAIEKAQVLNPQIAKLLLPDRVHPDPIAHWIMAETLLKGWNAPALVSSVTIDAAAGKVIDAQNSMVEPVAKDNGTLRWTEIENGLPLPLIASNATQALLLKLTDIQQALNQEPLRVTGLEAGQYKLTIDNDELAGAGPRRGAFHPSAHALAQPGYRSPVLRVRQTAGLREFRRGLDLRNGDPQAARVCTDVAWAGARTSIGEVAAGNDFVIWNETRSASYRLAGVQRLMADHPCNIDVGQPDPKHWKHAVWHFLLDYVARTQHCEAPLHAVQRTSFVEGNQSSQFIPIRFVPTNKLARSDKLMAGFEALALSKALGIKVGMAKIIHGDKGATFKVRINAISRAVNKAIGQVAALLSASFPPDLILNRHCPECVFQSRCRKKTVEKDDLSLLANLPAKERARFNRKGIFTVSQLSYTFRPRRRIKRLAAKREKYNHSLKALAIREEDTCCRRSANQHHGTAITPIRGPDRDFITYRCSPAATKALRNIAFK